MLNLDCAPLEESVLDGKCTGLQSSNKRCGKYAPTRLKNKTNACLCAGLRRAQVLICFEPYPASRRKCVLAESRKSMLEVCGHAISTTKKIGFAMRARRHLRVGAVAAAETCWRSDVGSVLGTPIRRI